MRKQDSMFRFGIVDVETFQTARAEAIRVAFNLEKRDGEVIFFMQHFFAGRDGEWRGLHPQMMFVPPHVLKRSKIARLVHDLCS